MFWPLNIQNFMSNDSRSQVSLFYSWTLKQKIIYSYADTNFKAIIGTAIAESRRHATELDL